MSTRKQGMWGLSNPDPLIPDHPEARLKIRVGEVLSNADLLISGQQRGG